MIEILGMSVEMLMKFNSNFGNYCLRRLCHVIFGLLGILGFPCMRVFSYFLTIDSYKT